MGTVRHLGKTQQGNLLPSKTLGKQRWVQRLCTLISFYFHIFSPPSSEYMALYHFRWCDEVDVCGTTASFPGGPARSRSTPSNHRLVHQGTATPDNVLYNVTQGPATHSSLHVSSNLMTILIL